MIKRFLLVILLINTFAETKSQNLPIGGWAALLPYRFATGVVQGNGKIYCITAIDIFSVTTSDNSVQEYNKVTGLSGTDITAAAYNSALGVLVIGYQNSNVDLLYDNGQIVNVPAIEQATITGNREVNSIYFIGSNAYICCGFGIVNLNLNTQLINDPPYYIYGPGSNTVNVYSLSVLSDTIYAATNDGECYSTLNDSLFVPTNWHFFSNNGLPAISTQFVQSFNNRMYAVQNSSSNASVYKYSNNKWSQVNAGSSTNWTVNGVTASSSNLVLAEDSANVNAIKITLINTSGNAIAIKPGGLGKPVQALQDNKGNLWIADNYNGLLYLPNQGTNTNNVTPNGPYTADDNSIAAYNGTLYVAPSSPSSGYSADALDGFFVYNNGYWTNYSQYNLSPLSAITNISNVVISPVDYTPYFGTWSDGLFHFVNGKIQTIYNATNSTLAYQAGNAPTTIASGMAYDNENNLWVSNFGAKPSPFSVFEDPSGGGNTWERFTPTVIDNNNFYGAMAVDQFDQKWIVNVLGGILVMNNAGSLTPSNADLYKAIGTGVGNGNLPTDQVTCLTVDQLGNVWVGTTEGITIFYCPGDIFTTGCDAQQPIYSTSAGNGYLLGTDLISAIVVDGANRKWVGTNSGLYLLSADGSQEVENFTAQNSPLFSNNIISLGLDPITGILYIGTDQGLLEYRTNATQGSQTNCNVTVFPDPVRPNYVGPITISGIVANATVKITDVTGGMVYETTALGGEATWNGNLQNGERAKTGVYLVFASSNDGTVHCTGKFLLIN